MLHSRLLADVYLKTVWEGMGCPLSPRYLDLEQLFSPAQELANMDAGNAGNLRDHCIRLKAGCKETLFLYQRPADHALQT